jgi:hypothetical protein
VTRFNRERESSMLFLVKKGACYCGGSVFYVLRGVGKQLTIFCSIVKYLGTCGFRFSTFRGLSGSCPDGWWSCWLVGDVILEATAV